MKNVAKSLADRVDEGGGGQRSKQKCFKEHARVRWIVNFIMIVCHFSSGDIKEERSDWYTLRSVGFLDLRHTLSAAVVRTNVHGEHQTAKGQKRWYGMPWKTRGRRCLSVYVEQKVSVALLASRDADCLGWGSKDETIADSREGEGGHRIHRKMTCGGVLCQESCWA